uniref:Superoxide dismutase [Cu-Zn] n=1 Tax=Bubo bubo TaxID=30461 RepID=A0A8C0FAY6_BUBBB
MLQLFCSALPQAACLSVQPYCCKKLLILCILFRQYYSHGRLEAIFYLDGFPLDNDQSGRAIHIHELGDLSNGCDSTGGHYNPFSVNHPRHPGDFGNFFPKDGKIRKYKTNLFATMFGPYSIMGRSIVIHEQEDDMGKGNNKASLENGNAGKRLACCVIGISRSTLGCTIGH